MPFGHLLQAPVQESQNRVQILGVFRNIDGVRRIGVKHVIRTGVFHIFNSRIRNGLKLTNDFIRLGTIQIVIAQVGTIHAGSNLFFIDIARLDDTLLIHQALADHPVQPSHRFFITRMIIFEHKSIIRFIHRNQSAASLSVFDSKGGKCNPYAHFFRLNGHRNIRIAIFILEVFYASQIRLKVRKSFDIFGLHSQLVQQILPYPESTVGPAAKRIIRILVKIRRNVPMLAVGIFAQIQILLLDPGNIRIVCILENFRDLHDGSRTDNGIIPYVVTRDQCNILKTATG